MGEAVCFFAGFGFLVAVLIGALILLLSVAVVNRFATPTPPEVESHVLYEDWDGEEEDERPRRRDEKAVPDPGIAKAAMITSTVGVVTVLFGVLVALFLEAVTDDALDRNEIGQVIVLAVFTLPLSCFGAALLFMAMLPTTFPRAAAVAFVYHALSVGLVAVVVGGIALLLP